MAKGKGNPFVTRAQLAALVRYSPEADAIAEGAERIHHPTGVGECWKTYGDEFVSHSASARDSFASLWGSINPGTPWSANPWVWVIEFRRISTP